MHRPHRILLPHPAALERASRAHSSVLESELAFLRSLRGIDDDVRVLEALAARHRQSDDGPSSPPASAAGQHRTEADIFDDYFLVDRSGGDHEPNLVYARAIAAVYAELLDDVRLAGTTLTDEEWRDLKEALTTCAECLQPYDESHGP